MAEDVLEVFCDHAETAMDEIEKLPGGQRGGAFRPRIARRRGRRRRARRPKSAQLLARDGRQIERIEKIVPSLEDVFVSLIEARDRAEQPQAEVQR